MGYFHRATTPFLLFPLVAAAVVAVGAAEPRPKTPADKALAAISAVDGEVERNPAGEVIEVRLNGDDDDSYEILFHSSDLQKMAVHLQQFPQLKSVSITMVLDEPADLKNLRLFPQLEFLSLESKEQSANLEPFLANLEGLAQLRSLGLWCHVDDAELQLIGRIKTLNKLSLGSGGFTETGLKHLQGLPLTELELGRAEKPSCGLANLASMTRLEYLNLGSLQINDKELKHLAKMNRLKRLNIGDGQLTDAAADTLAALPSLEDLQLGENPIHDGFLTRLRPLASLRHLDLSYTDISINAIRQFARARRDVALDFHKVRALGMSKHWPNMYPDVTFDKDYNVIGIAFLTETSPDVLATLKQFSEVECLTFAVSSPLTDETLARLDNLTHLKVLDLGRSKVTDAGLDRLKRHQALEEITLSGTKVSDRGLQALAALPHLKQLDLTQTEITDKGLQQLAAWKELRWAKLVETKVTIGGLRRFLSIRPTATMIENEEHHTPYESYKRAEATKDRLQIWFSPRRALGLTEIFPSDVEVLLNERLEVRSIYFSDAELNGRSISQIVEFPELESLGFYSGQTIKDDWLRHLSSLTRLKRLGLAQCKFTDAGFSHLAALHKLEDLDLSYTKIADTAILQLAQYPRLKRLNLSHTAISDAGLAGFKNVAQLEELELSGTKVTGTFFHHWPALQRLKKLDLGGTRLSDAALAPLSSLTGLQELDLRATGIRNTGLKHLSGLIQLRELRIDGNKISNAGLVHLQGLSQLQSLSLQSTDTDSDGCKALRAAIPKLSILESGN